MDWENIFFSQLKKKFVDKKDYRLIGRILNILDKITHSYRNVLTNWLGKCMYWFMIRQLKNSRFILHLYVIDTFIP